MMFKIGRMALAVAMILTVAVVRLPAQTPNPSSANPQGITKKPDTAKVTATDSIVVGAHLTPEEIEDGKINDVYQPLYHWKQSTDCAKIVELCETKIIPMAENSKFEETKNKFLFLANRDVAGCEMKAGQYEEAEQRYVKLLDLSSKWPGKSDSDYPQLYGSLGSARIMQGHWKEAEAALEQSISIFDEQIEKALHSDSEFLKNEHSKNLKMSEAHSRNVLASAYFWDGRKEEAMVTLENAYQEALQSNATPEMIRQIVENGRNAARLMGDAAAQEKWAGRTGPQVNSQQP
jgi:tetratricopeptide (TPR) repeat protein